VYYDKLGSILKYCLNILQKAKTWRAAFQTGHRIYKYSGKYVWQNRDSKAEWK